MGKRKKTQIKGEGGEKGRKARTRKKERRARSKGGRKVDREQKETEKR